jgi:hypothetical protein
MNESFKKSLSQSAYILIILWIITLLFGVLVIIFSIINLTTGFIWTIYFSNLLSLLPYALMFFPTLRLYISMREIYEEKKLEEHPQLIKSILIQFLISIIATIIVMLVFGDSNLTNNLLIEFFSIYSLWILFTSIIVFLIYILYSYFGEV